jgi:hypothetical protein
MQILYEDSGEFRVGAVLSQSPNSFQVETPHGRRAKIKAANVLLRFEQPTSARSRDWRRSAVFKRASKLGPTSSSMDTARRKLRS